MNDPKIVIEVDAGFIGERMDYSEIVELIGALDDYLGDWDYTIMVMDKLMTLMPDEESMGAEWMDDIATAMERWYAQLGVLILTHKTRRLDDDD